MYKLLSDLNIKNKKLQNLALLPGFDYETECKKSINIIENDEIIGDKQFSNFFNLIDQSHKKFTRKNKKKL